MVTDYGFIIQFLYLVLSILNHSLEIISRYSSLNRGSYTLGILPIAIMELTTNYLANKHLKIQIFCLPWKCNPIIYPIAILTICTVLNGICLQMLIGMLYGVLYYFCVKTRRSGQACLLKRCCCKKVSIEEAQKDKQLENSMERNEVVHS